MNYQTLGVTTAQVCTSGGAPEELQSSWGFAQCPNAASLCTVHMINCIGTSVPYSPHCAASPKSGEQAVLPFPLHCGISSVPGITKRCPWGESGSSTVNNIFEMSIHGVSVELVWPYSMSFHHHFVTEGTGTDIVCSNREVRCVPNFTQCILWSRNCF
jgi:hypothetical protein